MKFKRRVVLTGNCKYEVSVCDTAMSRIYIANVGGHLYKLHYIDRKGWVWIDFVNSITCLANESWLNFNQAFSILRWPDSCIDIIEFADFLSFCKWFTSEVCKGEVVHTLNDRATAEMREIAKLRCDETATEEPEAAVMGVTKPTTDHRPILDSLRAISDSIASLQRDICDIRAEVLAQAGLSLNQGQNSDAEEKSMQDCLMPLPGELPNK